jgi:hypothetical protein
MDDNIYYMYEFALRRDFFYSLVYGSADRKYSESKKKNLDVNNFTILVNLGFWHEVQAK